MSTIDTLCFSDYDSVTGAPTLDGYTGIKDDGIYTSQVEPGYVKGCRLTFDNGSGFPPVVFQGVKNGNYLNLSFMCRFDYTFDETDVLVIALRPNKNNPDQTTARRIDIFPVWKDVGADNTTLVGTLPVRAGNMDDDDPSNPTNKRTTWHIPTGERYHIRTDKTAYSVKHYRGIAGATLWADKNLDNSNYEPTIGIKVRSWQPPVPVVTTSVGLQTLSSNTAFTFEVLSTNKFPSEGVFSVNGYIVTYTGKTNHSFTGCKGGTGSVSDGSGVILPEAAWSIEVQLPLKAAGANGGGKDWIDLQDSFGLYFNLIRTGKTPASGNEPLLYPEFCTQFVFPITNPQQFITDNLNQKAVIEPTWYGTGLIPSLQHPSGKDIGLGLQFRNGGQGVGVRDTADVEWSPLGLIIHGNGDSAPKWQSNRLVAQVKNTATDNATGVTSEFRFHYFGLGSPNYLEWSPANGAVPDYPVDPINPTNTGISIPSTQEREITWTWDKDKIPSKYQNGSNCVWVQLASTGQANFVQSSIRINTYFIGLSKFSRPVVISGVGYPPPTSGNHHDFLLFTHARKIVTPKYEEPQPDPQPEPEPNKPDPEPTLNAISRPSISSAVKTRGDNGSDEVHYIWITEGYRRTGQTLTIGTKTTEILDESPGAFGFIAQHQGIDDLFEWSLRGSGLHYHGGGISSIRVPDGGMVTIQATLEAAPMKSKDEWPWWVWLLLIIFFVLIAILH